MPWSEHHYPSSMKNLPPLVRHIAIGTADALLNEGHEEVRAIHIGIARAKRWGAARRAAPAAGPPRRGWR